MDKRVCYCAQSSRWEKGRERERGTRERADRVREKIASCDFADVCMNGSAHVYAGIACTDNDEI